MNTKDGGPAFPLPVTFDQNNGSITVEEVVGGSGKSGMTLRDYFVSTAPPIPDEVLADRMIALRQDVGRMPLWNTGVLQQLAELNARWRGLCADAMLAEREKEKR